MRGAHRTLVTPSAPRCKCIYCNHDGGDIQSVISRELKRVRAGVLAKIDEDEVQDSEDDPIIDAEAGADAGVEVAVAETATAVPATDQGGNTGEDDN